MSAVTEGQAVTEAVNTDQPQPTAPEAPVTEGAKEPEKLSPQFAALARKEKALRIEAQKLKAEKESLLKDQESFKSSHINKDNLLKSPLTVLNELGITSDQLATMILNGPQAPDQAMAKLMARIDELEGKTTKVETEFKDQQSKSYEQAVTQIRNEAKILIDSDPAYETIKATNNIENVVEHIKRTFNEDGVLLSVEEAAKEVEELLVEEAMKIAQINKIKSRLQPAQVEEQKPQTNQKQQQIKTLTHDLNASTTKQTLSSKDRVKRAILRAQGLDPDTGKPIAG